ncbi:MAG: zf-TFIIB domain-containing protein [Candidatus Omnitrophica bacterium]|nr:zf-TFIIB domain-containing protein [Candidatus Omnitrophota bacterium]
MNCPVCQKEMVVEDFGGVNIDVCKDGCKGMWFDWMELAKLDEQNEGLGLALQEALSYDRANDNRGQVKCPKCSLPMHIHMYEASKEVNIDECYQCGGFFLDSGELKVIKESFMSEEERAVYMQKLLDASTDFKKAQDDLETEKARTQAIRNFTKFMCVSYYMTGK